MLNYRTITKIFLLCFLVLNVGCSSSNTMPNKNEKVIVRQDYLSKLPSNKQNMLNIATASQVIEFYFQGINQKDYDFVLATLSPGTIESSSSEIILKGLKEIVTVDNIKIDLENEYNEYFIKYRVTFDLTVVDNPTGAWGPGPTTRFFTLSKNGSRWCIVQISSSP